MVLNNNTFIEDSDLHLGNHKDNYIDCILPGEILQDGQWLRPDGQPVNCIDVTPSDPFQCTDNGTQNDAKITLYLNDHTHFGTGAELQYKCCLPTNCSDPTTNIMIINVFGKYIRSN